jgi:hypothetical protein
MRFELLKSDLMRWSSVHTHAAGGEGRVYMKFEIFNQQSTFNGATNERFHGFELRIMGARNPWLSERVGSASTVAQVYCAVHMPAASDDMVGLMRCLVDNANPIMENIAMLFAMQNQLEYEVEQPLRVRDTVNKAAMPHLVEKRSFAEKPFSFRKQP